MIPGDQRLEWVQRNRGQKRRVDRVERIGGRIAQLVEQGTQAVAEARDVVAVIHSLVDDAFREHCRVSVAPGSKVVIQVDHPVRLYAMRSHWHLPIRKALTQAGWVGSRNRIAFQVGTSGIGFDGVAEGELSKESW